MSPDGSSSGELLLFAVRRLLQAFDERLDVGIAAHRQPHLALVVGGRRSRARTRPPTRRSALRSCAAAPAPPSGWPPPPRSAAPPPTGSPTAAPRARTPCAARRRSPSAPRSSTAGCRGARAAPRRRRGRSSPTGRVCGTSPSSAPSVTTTCTPSASARSTMCVLNARQRIDGSTPCTSTRSRGARGACASKISTVGHSISRASAVLVEADARPVGLEVVELLRVDPREAPRLQRGGQERHRARGRVARVVPALKCAHHRRGPQAVRTAVPDQGLHPNHRTSWADGFRHASSPEHDPPATRSRPSPRCAATTSVDAVFACTRKERQISRAGTPYLTLELRDSTGAILARAFRDADVLAGRFERGELVRVRGRVQRFRDELQIDAARDRARRGPGRRPRRASCPPPTATATSSKASSSTSRARSTTRR